MDEIEFEVCDTEELVCPYCGYIQSDSWEFPNENDEWECSSCEKEFGFTTERIRTYTSYTKEEIVKRNKRSEQSKIDALNSLEEYKANILLEKEV